MTKNDANNKEHIIGMNKVFKCLGTSNHTDKIREENDYYATDPIAIDVLLNEGNVKFHKNIWECACGEGHLSERLKQYGYNVLSTDKIDRDYGDGCLDFLTCNETWNGDIITNPPYKDALEFVKHSLDIVQDGYYVAMLLKLLFLETKARKQLFKDYPLKYLYVSSSRIMCAKNAEFERMKQGGGGAIAYGWYVWQKGYKGESIIKWIN